MTGHTYAGVADTRHNYAYLDVNRADTPILTRSQSIVFLIIVMLYVASRLWNITAYSLWNDEIFSLHAARQDFQSLITLTVRDVVHPPLFYLLLKIWIGIGGESLLWVKLLPVLISIATILPFVLLCRELKLRAAEMNLALALMSVNGYLIHYAHELRMYSLLQFLTLFSMWLFVRFFHDEVAVKKHLLWLFLVNLLLVYTHYYGWVVVGTESIFLLFWGRRKLPLFLVSVTILALCFSPWIYAVAEAASNKGGLDRNLNWTSPPNLNSLIWYFVTLNGAFDSRWKTGVGMIFFALPILLWSWYLLKGDRVQERGRSGIFFWLLLFSFAPVIIAFSASLLLPHSVWHYRFLIIAAASYIIFLAIAIQRLSPNWFRIATLLFVLSWASLAGFNALNNSIRIPWEQVAQQMTQAELSQAEAISVYTFDGFIEFHLKYYLDLTSGSNFQVVQAKDPTILAGEHFWVAWRESKQGKEAPPQRTLTDRGYRVGEGFKLGPESHRTFLFPVWRN